MKHKTAIFISVLLSALAEIGMFYAVQNTAAFFIENPAQKALLLSLVFAFETFIIYAVILPKFFSKHLINPKSIFKAFLFFNIAFNVFSGIIGIYTYLYFVLINPNVMYLNLIIEDLYSRNTLHGNILFYLLLIAVTFAKPLLLKYFLEKKNA